MVWWHRGTVGSQVKVKKKSNTLMLDKSTRYSVIFGFSDSN